MRYRLMELLGQGGMGRVWKAWDSALSRQVAIKQVLFPPGMDAVRRQELTRRAMREARAAARLDHPGIITVHDVLTWDEAPVIVMEFIDGPSLAQVIAWQGRLPVADVTRIGASLVAALSAAHAAGIVHRDLKPANVLMSGDRVVITDFGIAHLAGDAVLTAPGALLGTPAFMAPEQARGQTVTPMWDMWALGATLYTALEGHPPYDGVGVYAILGALLSMAPPPLPEHAGPLAAVLARLLHKDPAKRMTTAQAERAFNDAAAGRPGQAGPAWAVQSGQVLSGYSAGHTSAITMAAITRLGGMPVAVTGSYDHTVQVWELATGRQLGQTLIAPDNVFAGAVGLLNGRTVGVTGGEDGLRIWDLAAGWQLGEMLPHPDGVRSVGLCQLDGRAVAVTGSDDGLRVWDLTVGEQLNGPLTGDTTAISQVAVTSLNGRTVAVSGGVDGLRIWDLATCGQLGAAFTAPRGVRALALSRMSSTTIAVTWGTAGLQVWDLVARRQLGTLMPEGIRALALDEGTIINVPARIQALAVDELNGRTVAVSGGVDGVRIWDLAACRQLGATFTAPGGVLALGLGRLNGATIAVTGSYTGVAQAWDLAGKAPLGPPMAGHGTGHTDTITAVTVTRLEDKAVAVTGGYDQTIRVWDLAARSQLGQPLNIQGRIWQMAVTRMGGTTVAVTSNAAGLQMWDLAAQRQLGEIYLGPDRAAKVMAAGRVGDKTIAVAGCGREVQAWDLATLAPLGEPLLMPDEVTGVAVEMLDGLPVAVMCSSAGTVHIWELDGGRLLGQALTLYDRLMAMATCQVDGKPVVVTSTRFSTGGIDVWDLATLTPLQERLYNISADAHVLSVGQFNGKLIAVTSVGDWLQPWDLTAGRRWGQALTSRAGGIVAVAVAQLDGRVVAITGSRDHTVRLWELGEP